MPRVRPINPILPHASNRIPVACNDESFVVVACFCGRRLMEKTVPTPFKTKVTYFLCPLCEQASAKCQCETVTETSAETPPRQTSPEEFNNQ